jgi:tRNA-dihydrouridine synthase
MNFLLAPMAEISHRALRELIEDFGGCDAYFSEMISAGALLAGGPFEKWYTDPGPKPEKCVFQLVGTDSEQISRAAAVLDRLDCAGIDINMGCSAPLIRKQGAGAAWMASIDRAGELISRVRPLIKRRLSVKLRIGFQDDFEYLVRFCRCLEEAGTELITLHPRTVTEKFKRLARWEYVGALRQELSIPVAGNGDIACAEDLVRRAAGPCDAVMVGRAAVRQPWIFAEARKIEENRDMFPNKKSTPLRGVDEKNLNVPAQENSIVCDNSRPPLGGRARRAGSVPENELCPQGRALSPQTGFVPESELCPQGRALSLKPSSVPETGLRFLELLARYQPPEFHISRARRFFGFFCDNLKWGNYLKNKINREDSLSSIERVWREYFKDNES